MSPNCSCRFPIYTPSEPTVFVLVFSSFLSPDCLAFSLFLFLSMFSLRSLPVSLPPVGFFMLHGMCIASPLSSSVSPAPEILIAYGIPCSSTPRNVAAPLQLHFMWSPRELLYQSTSLPSLPPSISPGQMLTLTIRSSNDKAFSVIAVQCQSRHHEP